MGFSLFSSPQHAMAAKNALQVIATLFSSCLLLFQLGYLDLDQFKRANAGSGVQDVVFDAETKAVLHTEMAKKNLLVKRGA